jgi:hypothetical protein
MLKAWSYGPGFFILYKISVKPASLKTFNGLLFNINLTV